MGLTWHDGPELILSLDNAARYEGEHTSFFLRPPLESHQRRQTNSYLFITESYSGTKQLTFMFTAGGTGVLSARWGSLPIVSQLLISHGQPCQLGCPVACLTNITVFAKAGLSASPPDDKRIPNIRFLVNCNLE